ncbi:uncharacterized protein [Elaeis guineensis]|uniref:uncharacterized protein isoform X1 n=1 Tax=Elaeis guineensis var. tenera TaxID=51953 RepID=UPI003C6D6F94
MIYRTPKGYFQAERGTMAVMDKYLGTNQVLCDILKSEQSIMRRHQQRKGSTTNDSKQAPRAKTRLISSLLFPSTGLVRTLTKDQWEILHILPHLWCFFLRV